MSLADYIVNNMGAWKRKAYRDSVTGVVVPSVFIEGSASGAGGLTDAELRASAVPVSGPLTDAQLRAAGVPMVSPGGITVIGASFQRPGDTTPYGQYDLIGINTSQNAGNAVAVASAVFTNGDGFRIERVRVRKSTNVLLNASFRLHVWRDLPTFTAIGDNGAQGAIGALVVDNMQYHVDYFDVTMDRAATGSTAGACGVGVPSLGGAAVVRPNTGVQFYYSLQALASGGYSPGNAETFNVVFEGQRA